MWEQHPGPPAAQASAGTPEEGDVIRILALEDSSADRSLFRRPAEWKLGRSEVPVGEFSHRVATFLESMRHVITGLPEAFGNYELDQLTISAEVGARGRLSLLGSGGELAGTAGITFQFTKRVPAGLEH